ncbi:DUF6578 domain-containing protein [Streptomyces griseofuscus]|uniref:Uncharacterized protein n=1 Tax=Streptomyces griseofuscus TaxID=146922 RepID=A0A426SA87_9ACTN|nr:DUF6578 domain-containing protein [Streptomyces griseofuscus]RRQ87288.1 hypothetical protein CQW44_10070 [Streptomyces griseofuscus]
MTLTIWVDDWQIQCCGENFKSGDTVSWHLLEVDPEDYADLVGSDRAAAIDFYEEHHGREDQRALTRLQVLTITEVHCRYEVPSDSTSNVRHVVPGTSELVPVREADGWAVARPNVEFAGYLVTAERTAGEQEG